LSNICDLFRQARAFDSQQVSGGVEKLEVSEARFTELMNHSRREYRMITTENTKSTEKNSVFSVRSVVNNNVFSVLSVVNNTL
jgi:type I restriction enzyme R subunit